MTASAKVESGASEDSSVQTLPLWMTLPLWIPLLIMLAVVVFVVWMGIIVVGWMFRHWIATSVSVGVILLMICFVCIAQGVGDHVKSGDDADDWLEDDEAEDGDEDQE